MEADEKSVMSDKPNPDLRGVSQTLLIPLYLRAMESQRPDALIKDEKAVEVVAQMSADESLRHDLAQVRRIPLSQTNKVVRILDSREFDRYARDFLACHPDAVVVHIGCGLDSRFERVDNGQVEWYDLDFPEVIALRRKFIGDEQERYHLLGCSVLEDAWLSTVSTHRPRPFLFLAECVFKYFESAQVKSLVLTLCDQFPGAELVFDAYSPFHVRWSNLKASRFGGFARARWGIWRGQKIEGWGTAGVPGAASTPGADSIPGADIHLLDEWGFYDRPEPRLAPIRWLRHIPLIGRAHRIYHFQLGKVTGL